MHTTFEGRPFHFGWVDDRDAVAAVLSRLPNPEFETDAAPHLLGSSADDDKDVFFWDAETKVLGKISPAWDQGQIGSCVSHGGGRAVQDLILMQCLTAGDAWPGHEVCREAIYGGSRVEIGGQRGSREDGSTGAWCADWITKYGILFYQQYPSLDLSGGYDVKRCGDWGASGVPADLETIARQHPVKQIARVTTAAGAWAALGNWYPINICGDISRTMKRRAGGDCPQVGNDWPHSQELCGRCTVKGGARKVCYRNSWGDYLSSDNNQIQLESGATVTLPQGVYLADLDNAAKDLASGDSWAYSSIQGFPAQDLDYLL